MLKYILIVVITISLFVNNGCKKNPIIPPPPPTDCTYPPGNRNFTWRMDTVAWFPSTVGGVWAFSNTDAYIMGYIVDGKTPYELRAGRHWNGEIWEENINGTYGYEKDIAIDPRNDVTGDDNLIIAVGFWGISDILYAGIAEFDNRIKKWKSYLLQTEGELRSVWTDGSGFFVAAGDNGMIYTKDGYSSGWVYSKAPTDFNFFNVTGVSKYEIYLSAAQSLNTGEYYTQGWKYYNNSWIKLFDTKNYQGTPLNLVPSDYPNKMGVWRCSATDSLKLYVIGDESYLFESVGQELNFNKINLTDVGLPLKNNGRTGISIYLFSPNDIWIIGTRYNFYHWNGTNFQRIIIPGLPVDDMQFGIQNKMIKIESGKIFFPSEVSSQVYVVLQGTP